jgi:hypothetical protein
MGGERLSVVRPKVGKSEGLKVEDGGVLCANHPQCHFIARGVAGRSLAPAG